MGPCLQEQTGAVFRDPRRQLSEVQAVRKMSEAVAIKLQGNGEDAPRLTAGEKEKYMVIILRQRF
jgi:hypothetical protein